MVSGDWWSKLRCLTFIQGTHGVSTILSIVEAHHLSGTFPPGRIEDVSTHEWGRLLKSPVPLQGLSSAMAGLSPAMALEYKASNDP
jgi:hypothetical protein